MKLILSNDSKRIVVQLRQCGKTRMVWARFIEAFRPGTALAASLILASAQSGASEHDEAYRLFSAVAYVESGGRADAVGDGGRALGILQIHPGVVADVNQHHGTAYTHRDALDPEAATDIFFRYLELYTTPERLGRPVTNEDRALVWHLGPTGFRRRDESPYREKAEAYLSKIRPLLK